MVGKVSKKWLESFEWPYIAFLFGGRYWYNIMRCTSTSIQTTSYAELKFNKNDGIDKLHKRLNFCLQMQIHYYNYTICNNFLAYLRALLGLLQFKKFFETIQS